MFPFLKERVIGSLKNVKSLFVCPSNQIWAFVVVVKIHECPTDRRDGWVFEVGDHESEVYSSCSASNRVKSHWSTANQWKSSFFLNRASDVFGVADQESVIHSPLNWDGRWIIKENQVSRNTVVSNFSIRSAANNSIVQSRAAPSESLLIFSDSINFYRRISDPCRTVCIRFCETWEFTEIRSHLYYFDTSRWPTESDHEPASQTLVNSDRILSNL